VRYSIGGWLHGENIIRPPFYIEPTINVIERDLAPKNFELEKWILPQYLVAKTKLQLKEYFENNSSIALYNFLIDSKLEKIKTELKNQEWKFIGPYNKRHYETLGRFGEGKESGAVKELKQFLRSENFLSYVESIIGLSLVGCNEGEFRKFSKSCYTLCQDNDYQFNDIGVDIQFSIAESTEEWNDDYGGHTTYMDEENELVNFSPVDNAFFLVLRGNECMRFVKYITRKALYNFYDLTNTFYIQEDENIINED